MKHFVKLVTIITKRFTLDVVADLDPPLQLFRFIKIEMYPKCFCSTQTTGAKHSPVVNSFGRIVIRLSLNGFWYCATDFEYMLLMCSWFRLQFYPAYQVEFKCFVCIIIFYLRFSPFAKAYLKSYKTSMMKLFVKIVNG